MTKNSHLTRAEICDALFDVLPTAPDAMTCREATEAVEKELDPSATLRGASHDVGDGQTRLWFDHQIRWARQDLKDQGILDITARDRWSLAR